MTLLPIVDRELRVAARRPATYWLRFIIGGAVFALWFLLFVFGPAGVLGTRGQMVFCILSAIAFTFAILSGPLLTADSLSQERREGTLGLLFLTELQGYDVVLGKLMATSVHAFYGMAAVTPLFCYSMLAGGVTLPETFRIAVALLTTTFFSLSAGMLVSAHTRDARQAVAGTLSVVIILPCILAGLGLICGSLVKNGFGYFPAWPSPIYLFVYSFDHLFQTPPGATQYEGSFIFVVAFSALMLLVAGKHLGRAWHEKEAPHSVVSRERSPADASFCGRAFSTPRGDFLSADPYLWLASRDLRARRRFRVVISVFFAVWCCICIGAVLPAGSASKVGLFQAALILAFGFHHWLKWAIGFEASRRFSEDRHSGALELLLVTPVSVEQIIAGQRRSLKRLFKVPILLAIVANAVLFALTIFVNPGSCSPSEVLFLAELFVGGAILMLVDFRALSWVAMWMALQTRRHTRAVQGTLLRVMLVPWLAIFVLVLLTIGGAGLTPGMTNGLCLFWVGLAGVVSHAFASRAKEGLLEAFRDISAARDASEANPPLLLEPLPAPAAHA